MDDDNIGKVSAEDYEDTFLCEEAPQVDEDGELIVGKNKKARNNKADAVPETETDRGTDAARKGTKRSRDPGAESSEDSGDDNDNERQNDDDSDDDDSGDSDMSELSSVDSDKAGSQRATSSVAGSKAVLSSNSINKKKGEKNVYHHGFNTPSFFSSRKKAKLSGDRGSSSHSNKQHNRLQELMKKKKKHGHGHGADEGDRGGKGKGGGGGGGRGRERGAVKGGKHAGKGGKAGGGSGGFRGKSGAGRGGGGRR